VNKVSDVIRVNKWKRSTK